MLLFFYAFDKPVFVDQTHAAEGKIYFSFFLKNVTVKMAICIFVIVFVILFRWNGEEEEEAMKWWNDFFQNIYWKIDGKINILRTIEASVSLSSGTTKGKRRKNDNDALEGGYLFGWESPLSMAISFERMDMVGWGRQFGCHRWQIAPASVHLKYQ